jgi:NAD(P)-dependent dehydrogenase (short-subunit alcohol dehydrogenase family)
MVEGFLKGKSVVIAGAGSGVGRAAAELFAQHGARLVCADIQAEWVEETVSAVKAAGGEAIAVTCDVSRKADVVAAVAAAVKAYGRLDVIYNNVGIPSPKSASGGMQDFAGNTEAQIEKLIAVNVKGVMHGCQAAVDQFRAQKGSDGVGGGVIVNTASAAGLMGWGGVLYGSTKGAVVNLTRALAMEVAKEGIRVNAVCPGGMATRFVGLDPNNMPSGAAERMGMSNPNGRIVEPLDAAYAALFLASDVMSSSVTGANLPVDGGMSAGRPLGG